MKIKHEEYINQLRKIKINLRSAQILTLDLSNAINDFALSKTINVLEKEISDLITGISLLADEKNVFDESEYNFGVPNFIRLQLSFDLVKKKNKK